MMKKTPYLIWMILLFLVGCDQENGRGPITIETEDLIVEIFENPAKGTILGTVKGSASSGSVGFSITGQDPQGAFSIDRNTGKLSVLDATLFDYEARKKLSATVSVSSSAAASNNKTANVTVNLKDVTVDDKAASTIIWNGSKMIFTKSDNTDPNTPSNQDRITKKIWLTRGVSGGQLYNIVTETNASKSDSPAGTEWSLKTSDDILQHVFGPFRSIGKPKTLVNKNLILHLIEEDIYINIKILDWSIGKSAKGGFSYERSTQN